MVYRVVPTDFNLTYSVVGFPHHETVHVDKLFFVNSTVISDTVHVLDDALDLPVNVKGYGFEKYFDYTTTFELGSLYYTVESDIKVKIFNLQSVSMDTPDIHEFLGV